MPGTINVQPQVMNLALYAGDGVDLRFVCVDSAGAPIDVTGAIKAQIRLKRRDPDPPVVEFSVSMVDAYLGIVVISLTGDQTTDLIEDVAGDKFVGVWDIQWTPAGLQTRTLCQGSVECVSDVTR